MTTAPYFEKLGAEGIPDPPRRSTVQRLIDFTILAAFIALLVIAFIRIDIRPVELVINSEKISEYLAKMVPGNAVEVRDGFRRWETFLKEMEITIYMAVWGTVLAIICAIPFGLLSSANLTPWWIHHPIRRMMDALRAVNELVFAIMFVTAVGLGPMAGMLALWLHTTGILAKLFSEAVEATDPRPVEGIRATGTGAVDETSWAVIPQVMPLWISYSLYRFESNVRSATVVGIVGAGGIGYELKQAIDAFRYLETGVILLFIIISVVIIDNLSALIRKRFI